MTNEISPATWSTDDFEALIDLVKEHECLYCIVQNSSRKDILDRETAWQQIAEALAKPVEECKQRWRTIRDGYMKAIRNNSQSKARMIGLFKKLYFLKEAEEIPDNQDIVEVAEEQEQEQVIMDNQEYYEITIVDENTDTTQETSKPNIKAETIDTDEPPKKLSKKRCGRKKYVPMPSTPILTPIKILPKPLLMNGMVSSQVVNQVKVNPTVVKTKNQMVSNQVVNRPVVSLNNVNSKSNILYVDDSKVIQPQSQRSEVIDSLIEKVLKEHTNEIDVFFRSMAATVKKLQPNLIPKVKMEVCNVIAKYEMQSFDKNNS